LNWISFIGALTALVIAVRGLIIVLQNKNALRRHLVDHDRPKVTQFAGGATIAENPSASSSTKSTSTRHDTELGFTES